MTTLDAHLTVHNSKSLRQFVFRNLEVFLNRSKWSYLHVIPLLLLFFWQCISLATVSHKFFHVDFTFIHSNALPSMSTSFTSVIITFGSPLIFSLYFAFKSEQLNNHWLLTSKISSLQEAFLLVPMSILSLHGENSDWYCIEHLQFHARFLCIPLKSSTDRCYGSDSSNTMAFFVQKIYKIQSNTVPCKHPSSQSHKAHVGLRLQHQSTATQTFPTSPKSQQQFSWQ